MSFRPLSHPTMRTFFSDLLIQQKMTGRASQPKAEIFIYPSQFFVINNVVPTYVAVRFLCEVGRFKEKEK